MIELKKIEPWQRAVDVIASFISEGNFRFTDKGVSFKAIDPSQIVLVKFFMDKASFDKYDVEPTFAGVDLSELSKIMNRAQQNDKLIMDVNDSELLITLEGEMERSFRLPLLDLSDEEVKLPEYTYDATVEITGKLLKESLKDASLFGSSVVLKISKGKFLIEAKGSHGTLNTSSKNAKEIKISSSKEIVAKYSLNYLLNIVKGVDSNSKVKLELKTDTPMRATYKIGNSEIQFLMAHMML